MPNTNPSVSKPPFRWGRVVLFTSLALNLAVVGVIGGAMLGQFDHKRTEYAARDIGFGLFSEALSDNDRKALRRAYGQAKKDIHGDRQQMRADLKALLDALRADPFDLASLRGLLDKGTLRVAERQALGQTILLERIEEMSAAERVALADKLEKSLKRRASKRAKKPKRDDD